jgi:hypothetical protein
MEVEFVKNAEWNLAVWARLKLNAFELPAFELPLLGSS